MRRSNKISFNTIHVFVDVTSCRMLKIYRHFGRYFCLILQGRIVQEETVVGLQALHILTTQLTVYNIQPPSCKCMLQSMCVINDVWTRRHRLGFQEVEAPRFQDSCHVKLVRLSALPNGLLYPPPHP